eukprot:INCI3267.1.p1 GENE.INCI3267.1~~INCI3267.1.p1  ORF type:complete len:666 (+),score=120.22 INCI3267.1:178-2175(+)
MDFVGLVSKFREEHSLTNAQILEKFGFAPRESEESINEISAETLASSVAALGAHIHPVQLYKAMHSVGMDHFTMLSTVCPSPQLELPMGLLVLDESRHELINSVPPQLVLMIIDSLLRPERERQPALQDFEAGAVAEAIRNASKILLVTGAGISTSCGIPDFRSPGGVYSIVGEEYPELVKTPEKIFSIDYFKQNVRPFFEFNTKMVKGLMSGEYKPSICHRFIAELEKRGKLLRQYTQNIDTLEKYAGVTKFIACHGSFSTVSCTRSDVCGVKEQDSDLAKDALAAGEVPRCPKCKESPPPSLNVAVASEDATATAAAPSSSASDGASGAAAAAAADAGADADADADAEQSKSNKVCELYDQGVLKHDIVMFGEALPSKFFDNIGEDCEEADLVIVIGTSLKVGPVNKIIEKVDPSVPQILINREVVAHGHNFDSELLGDCDAVVQALLTQLKWDVEGVGDLDPALATFKRSAHDSAKHRWIFANGVDDAPDAGDHGHGHSHSHGHGHSHGGQPCHGHGHGAPAQPPGTTPEGKAYLEANAKKEGWTVLPSGLQYKVLTAGARPGKSPLASTSCECHYAGTTIEGVEFDSSYKRGKPSTFAPNQVIAGWTEAMQLMVEGDKWELAIPSELAYGDRQRGQHITPGAVLLFTIEIVKVDGPSKQLS